LKRFTLAGVCRESTGDLFEEISFTRHSKHYALLNQRISTKTLGQKARRLPIKQSLFLRFDIIICLKKPAGIIVGTTSDFAAIQTTLPENQCL